MYLKFRKRHIRSTELTFEEKYPTDYCFSPSKEDIKWLEEKIKRDKKNLLKEGEII